MFFFIMEKPYLKGMIWGENPLFSETPIYRDSRTLKMFRTSSRWLSEKNLQRISTYIYHTIYHIFTISSWFSRRISGSIQPVNDFVMSYRHPSQSDPSRDLPTRAGWSPGQSPPSTSAKDAQWAASTGSSRNQPIHRREINLEKKIASFSWSFWRDILLIRRCCYDFFVGWLCFQLFCLGSSSKWNEWVNYCFHLGWRKLYGSNVSFS